jgi:hypothetical protein
MSTRDELRQRIQNQNAASPGQAPGAQNVAPPSSAPEASVPTPPAAPIQADPSIQAALDAEKAAREKAEREFAELRRQNQDLQAQMTALETKAQEQVQLPSKDELDGMSQGEALVKLQGAMTALLDAKVRGLASEMNAKAIAPVREGLAKLTLTQKLDEAKSVGGENLVNKYRSALEAKAGQYPDMSGADILKLVASPQELSSPQAPTTPTAEAPAAAYMEGGRSAHASQPSPGNQPPQATVADKLTEAQTARNEGRHGDAKAHFREATKMRLAANAAQRSGVAGG